MKKFALAGMVSAMKPDIADQTELGLLSMATCVNANQDGQFYDLSNFNKAFRNYNDKLPWYVDMEGDNTFYYKACQLPWKMADKAWAVSPSHNSSDFQADTWPSKVIEYGTAYMASGSDRTYTFVNSDIKSLPKVDGKTPEGWTITWTSLEDCSTQADQKYKVVLTGECVNKALS